MARRRKKNETSLLPALIGLIFIGMLSLTKSLIATLFVLVIVLVLAFVGMLMIKSAKAAKLKRSGIAEIDKMDGRQFEHYLGQLFKSQGYGVEVTKSSGDYGADLLLKKEGRKIVVQAKRYSQNVGVKAVQEAKTSAAYYGASDVWVVTNSRFTEQAQKLARANGVRLMDREELIEQILRMNPQATPDPKQVMADLPLEERFCTKCGKKMVLRTGPRGEFYGCSGYPSCRNTVDID